MGKLCTNCVDLVNGCDPVDTSSVIYKGPNLPCSTITTGDSLTIALQKIDALLCVGGGEQNNFVRDLFIDINDLPVDYSLQDICNYILALPEVLRTILETDSKWNVLILEGSQIIEIYEIQNIGKGIITTIEPDNLLLLNIKQDTPGWQDVLSVQQDITTYNGIKLTTGSIYMFTTSEFGSYLGLSQNTGINAGFPTTSIGISDIFAFTYNSLDFYQDKTLFKDSLYSKGIEYAGDYEPNFTARSLITQQYLLSVISGSISGTTNTIPKFITPNSLGDSSITDDGSLVTISNPLIVGGTILPSAAITYNVGSPSVPYANVVSENLNASNIIARGSAITFYHSNINPVGRIFTDTGNLLLQNGGTFINNGIDRLQVSGSALVDGLRYTRGIDISGQDLDSVVTAGFYSGNLLINAPSNQVGFFYITVERWSGDSNWAHQTATAFGTDDNIANKIYSRVRNLGTWTPWVELYTTGSLVDPITGTGVSGQVAFWNGTNSQTGDNGLFWNNTTKNLGLGTSNPLAKFNIESSSGYEILFTGSTNTDIIHYIPGTEFHISTIGTGLFLGGSGDANHLAVYPTGNVAVNSIDTGARFTVGGTVNATSGIARGAYINNNLVATANNDFLTGLVVNPTFNNGAFTGVNNWAISTNGNILLTGTNRTIAHASGNLAFGGGSTILTGGGAIIFTVGSNNTAGVFTSGNWAFQTGGVLSDAGYKIDVQGTTRLAQTVTLGTQPTTSIGTYDILTRNTGTGAIEKVVSSTFELLANKQNSMVVDGTGVKYPTVDAVNFQTNYIARAVVATGFLDTTDPFSISRFDDFTLHISTTQDGIAFSQRFKTLPYAPSDGIINIVAQNVPLSVIPLAADGTYIRFVGIQIDGTIVWSPTQFIQSPSVCQLGIVLVKRIGGVISFIDATRTAITIPDVAAYSNLDTTSTGVKATTSIAAIPGTLSHTNTQGKLVGISVAWGTSNTDSKVIPLHNPAPTPFTRLHPGNALPVAPPPPTFTVLDPTQAYIGGVFGPIAGSPNQATVQRLGFNVNGNFVWQYGEKIYSNLIAAQNNVLQAPFTDILPEGTFAEIGRMAITVGCTDLNSSSAQYYPTGASGGGGTSPILPTAWGAITGNIDDQLDLKAKLDDKVSISLANTISGVKTFLNGTLGLRNVANSFTSSFTNSVTAARTWTLPDKNGIVAMTSDIPVPLNGTVNKLIKFGTTSTGIDSRVVDNGLFLGIDSISPVGLYMDLQLGRQGNKIIGIEQSNSLNKGCDLTVQAGRTINTTESSLFVSMSTGTVLTTLGTAVNGDNYGGSGRIFYGENNSPGDIYKQIGGSGPFIAMGQASRSWNGFTGATGGNIYATVWNGDIYMQTAGIGAFVGLGAGNRSWTSIIRASNNDIYACVLGGDIYKQTNGIGAFTALGQTARQWNGFGVHTNGDVYAYVTNSGHIYKQAGGVGDFVIIPISFLSYWSGVTIASNGDLYASRSSGTPNGSMYKSIGGVGAFIATGQVLNYSSMTGNINGNIYTAIPNDNVYYLQLNAIGEPNLDGGILKLKSGTGKGIGKSRTQIITGQKTVSGTDMQVETVRAEYDENGNYKRFGTPVYADNAEALAGGLTAGMEYRTAIGVKMEVY
jgi:hypothetical protein